MYQSYGYGELVSYDGNDVEKIKIGLGIVDIVMRIFANSLDGTKSVAVNLNCSTRDVAYITDLLKMK